MKITAIETIRLQQHPNVLMARVFTDAGITGLGETFFGADAVEADIHARIAGEILGQDPTRIEFLNAKMRPYAGFGSTGAEMRALSMIDVALWDIAAKSMQCPLHDLLGGATRASIPVYNTCAGPHYVSQTAAVRPDNFGTRAGEDAGAYEDLDGFRNHPVDLAASLLDMGISSMKIWPFDFAQGAADGIDISVSDLNTALRPFEKIRAKFGDKMRLKAELHGLWSLNAARKICAALEPIGMDWVEDPIWMDRTEQIGELAATTSVPLAGGETLATLGQFSALMDLGKIATPIMDVVWAGGITAARKIAVLAEARGRPIAFHDCSGPVTLAVSTHLALSQPNVREQEFTRGFYSGWYGDFVENLPPIRQGMISAPIGNGHGLELKPGLAKRDDVSIRISKL
jgi:L-alanine-DL-glutamate epimerase-like enolase superfamily enzyme